MHPISNYRGVYGGAEIQNTRYIKFQKIYKDGYEKFHDMIADEKKEFCISVVIESWAYDVGKNGYFLTLSVYGEYKHEHYMCEGCKLSFYSYDYKELKTTYGRITSVYRQTENLMLAINNAPFHYNIPQPIKMELYIEDNIYE
jgi:hypothetical protein